MSRQLFRQLSKESFLYGLSAAAAKLVGFFLVPIYTRSLVQADYGILDLLVTGMSVLSSVMILGMDSSVAMVFYRTDDPREHRTVTSTFLIFELAFAAAMCGLLLVIAEPLAAAALGSASYLPDVQLAIATIPFAICMTMFLDVTRLLRLPLRYMAISVGNLLLTSLLIIIAVVLLHMGVPGILGATLLGNAIFSVVAWISTRKQYGWYFSTTVLARMIALGAPLAVAAVALWVVSFSNRWFLLHLTSSAEEVAIYALASRLVAPVVLMVTAFQIAWVPFSLSIAREQAAPNVYARTALYFLSATLGVLLLITLWADPLIQLFSTSAYLPAAQVIAVVGAAGIASGLYFIVSTGLNLAGKTLHVSWITLVAAAVGIGLNLLLIPVLGVLGAAIAGLAATTTPVILIYVVAQRIYRIPYDLARITALSLVAVVLLVIATVVRLEDPFADFALRVAVVLVYIILLVPIGVLREREVNEVRRVLRRLAGRWAGT